MVSHDFMLTLPVRGSLTRVTDEGRRALGGSVPAQREGGRAESELGLTPGSQGPCEGLHVAWEDSSPHVHQEIGPLGPPAYLCLLSSAGGGLGGLSGCPAQPV